MWWFQALLDPFLTHYVEDEEFDGEIISLQHFPVDVGRVASLRSRVLELVSTLAEYGDEGVVLNSIKVLGQGIRMFNMPGLTDDDDLQRLWLPQRQSALGKLERITLRKPSGFVAWSIWLELWWYICYEPANLLRGECWRVFDLLEDTFELRLARTVCSSGDSEVTPLHKVDSPVKLEERAWEKSRELWRQLCEHVAQELVNRYSDAAPLHEYLADFVERGAQLGFQPGLGTVVLPLSRIAHGLAGELAHEILESPREEAKHAFGSLVGGLSPQEQPVRLDLAELAARSANTRLQMEASRLLIWWQRQNRLPKSGQKVLLQLVKNGQAALVRSALHEASFLPGQHSSFVQQLLVSVLDNPISDDITEPLLAILDRSGSKNSKLLPDDLVALVLKRLVLVPQFRSQMEQHYLANLSEIHPKEIFAFYLQRVTHSRETREYGLFDSRNYEAIPRPGRHASFRSFAEIPEFETSFRKIRDELIGHVNSRLCDGNGGRVYERGGYHWHLRQLARWLLDDSGSNYTTIVSDWIPLLVTLEDHHLFLDVVVSETSGFVLSHPELLDRLLSQIESSIPEHLSKAREDLMFSVSRWVGASRNPQWRKAKDRTPFEDEEPWQIIPRVEKNVQAHLQNPVLKAFYDELLGKCQAMLTCHRRLDQLDQEGD